MTFLGGMFEEKKLLNFFVIAAVNTSVDFKPFFTLGHYEIVERLFPEGDTEAKVFFCIFVFYVKERFIKRNYPSPKTDHSQLYFLTYVN